MATKKTPVKKTAKKTAGTKTAAFMYTTGDDNYLVDNDVTDKPFTTAAAALERAEKDIGSDPYDGETIQIWQLVSKYEVVNPVRKVTLKKVA